jgi:hypothetical protein
MAGHSRSKDGVAFARLCPAILVLLVFEHKDVDARDKPGHDENKKAPAKPGPSENADDKNQRE